MNKYDHSLSAARILQSLLIGAVAIAGTIWLAVTVQRAIHEAFMQAAARLAG